MTHGIVLRGVRVPMGKTEALDPEPKDVVIDAGQIASILPAGTFFDIDGDGYEWIPCDGWVVLPGLVDDQVRYSDPASPEQADFRAGSLQSARGGATTVLEVQSFPPWVTRADDLVAKRNRARSALVNIGLFANAASGKSADLKSAADHCVGFRLSLGPIDGDRGVDAEHERLMLFEAGARTGKVISIHAADPDTLSSARRRYPVSDAASLARSEPPRSEIIGCDQAIRLCEETGARIHLLHLSTAGGVDALLDAKDRGLPVTGATTPHHLLFTHDDVVARGPSLHSLPTIKSSIDRDRLREGVRTGVIDVVQSDHSSAGGLDDTSYVDAARGFSSASGFLPALLGLLDEGVFSDLSMLIERSSRAPARIFGLPHKGRVEVGGDADLVIVDWERLETPESGAFAGIAQRGVVMRTLVGGRTTWARSD